MAEVFTAIADLLTGLAAFGFVLFLFTMRRPIGAALVAVSKRDSSPRLKRLLAMLEQGD